MWLGVPKQLKPREKLLGNDNATILYLVSSWMLVRILEKFRIDIWLGFEIYRVSWDLSSGHVGTNPKVTPYLFYCYHLGKSCAPCFCVLNVKYIDGYVFWYASRCRGLSRIDLAELIDKIKSTKNIFQKLSEHEPQNVLPRVRHTITCAFKESHRRQLAGAFRYHLLEEQLRHNCDRN